jgi:photosystem II stability/assembly factor-like uncharacterized protein
LTLTPAGIETKIGSKAGTVAWGEVEGVMATPERVYITGKNANAFTLPGSAFSSDEGQTRFVELANRYLEQASRPATDQD